CGKSLWRRKDDTNYYFLGSKGTGGTQNCSTADAHPYSGVLNGSPPHFTTTRDVIDMPCGEWHHVAAVFDYDAAGASLSIYYDGVLKDTQNRVVAPFDDSNIVLYIGAYAGGNTHFFQGYLDEIYIFDKALTESQIRDLAYLP
ncbi:MAG: LamG domain-containing protein, partial [Thermodesulfobacteriota bacterium]|nr:LamG domain-containing protein [Thermodesulfobacteriota bacterium]